MIAFNKLIEHRKNVDLCGLVKSIFFSYFRGCTWLKILVSEMIVVPELVCLSLIPSVVLGKIRLFFFLIFFLYKKRDLRNRICGRRLHHTQTLRLCTERAFVTRPLSPVLKQKVC